MNSDLGFGEAPPAGRSTVCKSEIRNQKSPWKNVRFMISDLGFTESTPVGSTTACKSEIRNQTSEIPSPGSGASGAVKPGAGDLSLNWPRSNELCRILVDQVSGGEGPQCGQSTVVTWTASRPLAAKGFGGRRSRRAESRKAMETTVSETLQPIKLHEAGGQRAERQWRHSFVISVVSSTSMEAGGQRAERQWRPEFFRDVHRLTPGSRRAESRKAMETFSLNRGVDRVADEAGGQRAERQWRPLFPAPLTRSSSRSRRAESRKAMET